MAGKKKSLIRYNRRGYSEKELEEKENDAFVNNYYTKNYLHKHNIQWLTILLYVDLTQIS